MMKSTSLWELSNFYSQDVMCVCESVFGTKPSPTEPQQADLPSARLVYVCVYAEVQSHSDGKAATFGSN